MKTMTLPVAAAILLALSACSNSDRGIPPVQSDEAEPPASPAPEAPAPEAPSAPQTPPATPAPEIPTTDNPSPPNGDSGLTVDPPVYRNNSVFVPHPTDIGDYNAFYSQDGYETVNVVRMDIRIPNTVQGICTIDDQSGCTLADVIADINGNDDFKVEIPVHASGLDLPDDGSVNNATLRQRGNTARFGPQKSFRLKLDSKENLWRNERRLQLNKNPFEPTRYKNKLAFDLFQNVPHFPSLRTQFVNLWIDNGQGPEDFGLFTHTEFVGKEYVANRVLGEDDNLYKIEFFRFSQGDLNSVQVKENGKPLDKEAFASRLEIENGDDHRALVTMLEAMVDPTRTLDSVIEEHFNRNNLLTWLATNLILRQADAITHNFYLYNPAGTERFYILPWDYDGTFEPEQVLTNSFDNSQLQKRKFYGYARGLYSELVERFYREPGAHDLLVRAIDELRANYYSDEQILERATALNNAVEPFLTRLPDSNHVNFAANSPERLVSVINQNYNDIINNYGIPMEPTVLGDPQIDASGILQLEWEPAFDVTGANTLTYDLIISSSPFFEPDNTVFSIDGIPDVRNGLVSYPVNTTSLPSGRVYVRIVARGSTDPQRIWQTNNNFYRLDDGTDLFGMLAVDLP
ncbi:MAG: CotH kinase family protein [Granulosicoccus sp.]